LPAIRATSYDLFTYLQSPLKPPLKRASTESRIYKYMKQVVYLELGELCSLPEIKNQGIQVTRTIT